MENTRFECGGGICGDTSHTRPDSWVDIAGGISQSCEDHSLSFKGWRGDDDAEWNGCTWQYQESVGWAPMDGVNQGARWWPTPGGVRDVWDEDLCIDSLGGPDPKYPPYVWYSWPSWSATISGIFGSVYDLDFCISKQLIGTIYWPDFDISANVVVDSPEYKRVEIRGSAPKACSSPESSCEADAVCADLVVLGAQECQWFWKSTTRCDEECQGYDFTPRVTSVNAASYGPFDLAPHSIVAAFGQSLATATEWASIQPLPTRLGGTTVRLYDSSGTWHDASLFFVSPAQVNYLIPPGTALGPVRVTVLNGDHDFSKGNVMVAEVGPGLFSADGTGKGLAAGNALRVKADGQQITELIHRFDTSQDKTVPVPIDLGPEGDQVFLILYGTGIRHHQDSCSATMGGLTAEVVYAGPQGDFAGLDQVNVRIPRTLIGRGQVDVSLTVDGKPANIVNVTIR
jgi:uncharacterized protein (TIGR03437 family)